MEHWIISNERPLTGIVPNHQVRPREVRRIEKITIRSHIHCISSTWYIGIWVGNRASYVRGMHAASVFLWRCIYQQGKYMMQSQVVAEALNDCGGCGGGLVTTERANHVPDYRQGSYRLNNEHGREQRWSECNNYRALAHNQTVPGNWMGTQSIDCMQLIIEWGLQLFTLKEYPLQWGTFPQ